MKRDANSVEVDDVGLAFNYRLSEDQAAPLVVFVHGRAGDRNVMWTFERCVPPSWSIVSFQAFLPDDLGGWSWWHMTQEGSSRAAIMEACRRLEHALERFRVRFSLQPRITLGCGFSQGAVLVSAAGLSGLIQFNGIAILAGFALLPKEDMVSSSMPQSVFVAHGTKDEIISVDRTRNSITAIRSLGIPVNYVEEEVGHKVGIQGTRGLRDWFFEWDRG